MVGAPTEKPKDARRIRENVSKAIQGVNMKDRSGRRYARILVTTEVSIKIGKPVPLSP